MRLEFDVRHQTITRKDKNQVVAVSQNYLEMQFTFTSDWTGLKKILYVKLKGTEYCVELINDMVNLDIPSDGVLKISLQGTEENGSTVVSALYGDFIAITGSGFKNADARYVRSLNISEINVINGIPCYEHGGAWLPLSGTITDVPNENTGKILIGDVVKSITEENFSTAEKEKLALVITRDMFDEHVNENENDFLNIRKSVNGLRHRICALANQLNREAQRNIGQDEAIGVLQGESNEHWLRINILESAGTYFNNKVTEMDSDIIELLVEQALFGERLEAEASRNDARDDELLNLRTDGESMANRLDEAENGLMRHIEATDNPHSVTPGQIGALRSIDIEQGENIIIVRGEGETIKIHSTAVGGGSGGGGIISFAVNMETGYLEVTEIPPTGIGWRITEDGILEAIV